ncbi:autotransporter domain-containing protein [Microbulbifer agarilyticus]|uniref:autotransporter outer membrane beta-barrel domain-containing protein n=1 Tax=Microbulbifer agarilyticus TaxID=260552 RepID=UPI001C962317|nr:autotransporter domain-containing protein [Microbulbifer agarilyticus]MBY6191596.1 autotransporter domain-containing protein [Microbulbifer agarilyticus]
MRRDTKDLGAGNVGRASLATSMALLLGMGIVATEGQAEEAIYGSLIVFGDSLSDNGNAGVFTSEDPQGIYPRQPAVSFLADLLGLPKENSCFGLGPAFGGVIPCAPAPGTIDQQLQQIVDSVLTNGPNWAVGGNRTADVLLDLVGPQQFRVLFPDTTVADHNTLTTILPDSSRCGADGICNPAQGESPYLSPVEVAAAVSAFNNPAALQALVDDPNNNITLTGVPFATGQGYLPQNTVSPNDLYFLNGGGNNILDGVSTGTINFDSMTRAATFLSTAGGVLKAFGAKYIVMTNTPRIGNTPAINVQGQAAINYANLGTEIFNDRLRRQVNEIGNILLLDMEGILELAIADPTAFGFANIDQSAFCYENCATPSPVYGVNGTNPNADLLIFYDGIHPTLAAQRLLADYYYQTLTAAIHFGVLPDLGYENMRQHRINIDHHLISQRYRDPTTTVFFGASVGHSELGVAPAVNDEYPAWDGFLGMSFAGFDHLEWGLSMSYGGSEYEPTDLFFKARNFNLSAFARWDNELFFLDGGVTFSNLDYDDVQRTIRIGNKFRHRLDGDTDGEGYSVFLRAGYDTALQACGHLGPFVSFEWTEVDVNGFRERTADRLTYAGSWGQRLDPLGLWVHGQDREYLRSKLGFFYNGDDVGEHQWFGEFWLETTSGDDYADLGIGVNSIFNNWARLPSYRSKNTGIFQNGVGAMVGVSINEKLRIAADVLVRPDDAIGGLSLNYRF